MSEAEPWICCRSSIKNWPAWQRRRKNIHTQPGTQGMTGIWDRQMSPDSGRQGANTVATADAFLRCPTLSLHAICICTYICAHSPPLRHAEMHVLVTRYPQSHGTTDPKIPKSKNPKNKKCKNPKTQTSKNPNFFARFCEFEEKFWILGFSDFWIYFLDFLDSWIFGCLDFWTFGCLDFVIFRFGILGVSHSASLDLWTSGRQDLYFRVP